MSGGTFWGSKFLLQVVFLHACFRNLREKFSELGLTLTLRAVKRAFYMPRVILQQRLFFLRRIDIYRSDFRVWPAVFLTFGDKVSQGSRKVHISRPDIIWARTTVFIKPILLNFFRTLMRIFFGNFWRKFWRCRQKSNLRVRKFFVELHNFRGTFYFSFWFRPSDKKSFFEKISAWLKTFFSACPKKVFAGEKF